MRPVAAIPMNDPNGMMFPHLQTITPTLKKIFGVVYVSLLKFCTSALSIVSPMRCKLDGVALLPKM